MEPPAPPGHVPYGATAWCAKPCPVLTQRVWCRMAGVGTESVGCWSGSGTDLVYGASSVVSEQHCLVEQGEKYPAAITDGYMKSRYHSTLH
eukprot:2863244-Rhodomonas_salina.2